MIKRSSLSNQLSESHGWWDRGSRRIGEWTYEGGRKLCASSNRRGKTVPVTKTENIQLECFIKSGLLGNLGGTAGFLRLVPIGAGRFLIL